MGQKIQIKNKWSLFTIQDLTQSSFPFLFSHAMVSPLSIENPTPEENCFVFTLSFVNLLFCQRPHYILRSGFGECGNHDSLVKSQNHVTPAKAGVHNPLKSLDSCFRRNDR